MRKRNSPAPATFEKCAREIIRLRDKTCQFWKGLIYDEIQGHHHLCQGQLEVAHLIPRGGHRNVRYDPENLVLLCHFHHNITLDRHPLDKDNWIRRYLGDLKWEALRAKDVLYIGKDADKREEYAKLKAVLREMK